MLKRPLCGLAVGFLLGILIFVLEKWYCILAVITVITALAVSACKQRQWKRGAFVMMLFLIACFCGSSRYQYQWKIRKACQSQITDGMHLRVQGVLDSKEYKNNQYIYYLKDCFASFPTGILPCNQIIAYSDTDEISIGKTLIINGTIEEFQIALNEGNFDEKSYYYSRGIDFKINPITVERCYGKENGFREALYLFRENVKQVYEAYMEKEDAGVMSTMTLGDKSLLDAEIKSLYQGAGISHILAISGLHISVIGMSLYKILRKIGLPYTVSGILAGGCMMAYAIMTGLSASTIRAVLMFLLMLLGQSLGRSYDSLNALCVAAVFLLWENPFLVEYAGFLFSFAAVLGVVIVGKTLEKVFLPQRKLAKTLLVSLAIQLTTLPLVAVFYYELPMYTMPVNLVVLPFLNVLLFLGLAGGIVGLKFGFWAKICFFPCHWILYLYRSLCERCNKLPGAEFITGKPEEIQVFTYYLILLVVLFGLWKRAAKKSEEVRKDLKKGKKAAIFTGSLLLAFFILLWEPKKGLEVDVLSVGQGDGIFLQTGDGVHLFIDGGSSDVKKVGSYRILPFFKAKGIRSIDYWLISHTDTDHISGLTELLEEGFAVGTLVFSKELVKDEAYEQLKELAEKNGTEIMFLNQGDCIHFGKAKLTCLFPDADYKVSDKNSMSLAVCYEEEGFSAVFTGDMDAAAEKRLVESGILSEVFLYKAAHHGSNGSNSSEILEVLKPEIAVVSCGLYNSYGHPGKEAVKRMEESGCRIFYTMNQGQISIQRKQQGIVVEKHLMPLDVWAFSMIE